MKRLLIAATALAGVAFAQNSWAQSSPQTATITVTATVPTQCSVSANPLSFGTIDLTANSTANAEIDVTCTSGGNYNVSIDNGLYNASGLRMSNMNGQYLNYNIWHDSAHGETWTSPTGDLNSLTGTGAIQPLQVYGVVPSQLAPSGPYNDTLTVNVTF